MNDHATTVPTLAPGELAMVANNCACVVATSFEAVNAATLESAGPAEVDEAITLLREGHEALHELLALVVHRTDWLR